MSKLIHLSQRIRKPLVKLGPAFLLAFILQVQERVRAQPRITKQPTDLIADVGSSVTNQVTASGAAPLNYQWFLESERLVGATNRLLVLTNLESRHAGVYSVVVGDSTGTATSSVARLMVNVPLPHGFAGIRKEPGGASTIELSGNPAAVFHDYFDLYRIDASTDLRTWFRLPPILRTNANPESVSVRDSEAAQQAQSFYRTRTNHLVTLLPTPTGPFAVGIVSMLLTDGTRLNRYGVRTNGSFMISLWYPAQALPGIDPERYIDLQLAQGNPDWASRKLVVPHCSSHSDANAPMAAGQRPCPVILYSAGTAGLRKENSAKMEELASHGYVVVGIDQFDCYGTVFPDGRYLRSGIGGPSSTVFNHNVRDLQFVLGELAKLDAADPRFQGRLDLERVGSMGFSTGGGAAGEFTRIDDRVKATVFLDAYFQNADTLKARGMQKPFLALYEVSNPLPEFDRLAFFNKATNTAYFAQLKGTEHWHFWDAIPWILTPTASNRRLSMIQNALIVSFFNKHLKGEDDHLLDDPTGAYPEVAGFRRR
jgi:dienelactone hydrolase